MRSRLAGAVALGIGLALTLAGCGDSGSSSDNPSSSSSAGGGAGCAPVSGNDVVVLQDDKKLQTVDNIIPAVNTKAAKPEVIAALDKVSAALDTDKLVALNKKAAVDRDTPANIAKGFVDEAKLTDGLTKGSGSLLIGAANFPENQILANIYALTLKAAGFSPTVKTIGNRELYLPSLEKGQLQIVPEYAGTVATFINKAVNGATAPEVASPDLDKTVTNLIGLGNKVGLTFGKPSEAADQNAFAVNKKLADEKKLKTLSDFAKECSGTATLLGGPPECPQRPFCQPGLEKSYAITFGKFISLDAGGPLTLTALKNGKATIGLVLSSDGSLSANS